MARFKAPLAETNVYAGQDVFRADIWDRKMSSPQLQDVRYARYEVSHFTQLRELFKTVWGAYRSIEYDIKHWNETLTGVCPAVVGLCEAQVVGFYMVWPMLFSDGKEQVLGGQPIDSMVHPDFQGKGMLRELACRCYELCSESNLAVMFGAPNRAAYAGNIGALNWCHVGNIVESLRPLAPMSYRSTRWVEQEGRWICDSDDSRLSECIAQRNCPLDLGALCEEFAPLKRSWQVSRTAQWLGYRYRSVPDAEYYAIRLPEGRGRRGAALCGFRKSGLGVKATLVEVIASDEDTRKAVVSAAASWARHKGARFLIAKSTNNDPNERLLRRGFVPFRRTALISRTLSWRCYSASPFSPTAWALYGGAFDTM
jgi:GNAT superfamily N-acetyltransferase